MKHNQVILSNNIFHFTIFEQQISSSSSYNTHHIHKEMSCDSNPKLWSIYRTNHENAMWFKAFSEEDFVSFTQK